MKRLVLSLAVMVTALALAAGMALAQANTVTVNEKVPFNLVLENRCTGEPVRFTGNLLIVFHITEDAKGGIHVQEHFQPQGVSGTGLESGEQYRAVGVSRRDLYFAPGEEVREFTRVSRFFIVSKGPSENLLVAATIHVTINPNGEVTAEIDRLTSRCVG